MEIRLKISGDPTKQEEIDLVKKLVETLPVKSYLKNILKDLPMIAEREIKSDFDLPVVSGSAYGSAESRIEFLDKMIHEVQSELNNERLLKSDLELQLKRKERELAKISEEKDAVISELRSEVETLGFRVDDLNEELAQINYSY